MADKTEAPITTLFNWGLTLWPRNTDERFNSFTIEVQATSKQEAINKALSQHPGHAWGPVIQLEAEPPHILVQEGKPVAEDEEMPAMKHWDVTLYRSGFEDITIRLVAKSKEQACQKAISAYGSWNVVRTRPAEPPKAAHEASVIHERSNLVPNPLEAIRDEVAAVQHASAERYLTRKVEQMTESQKTDPAFYLTPEQEQGLWAQSWEPTRREGEELSIAQIVQEAIGSASMCWKQTPTGIFDSERASWVASGAIDAIERVVFWQTGFHPGGKSMTLEEAEQKVAADAHESDVLTAGAPLEIGMAEEPEECRQARIRRDADKAAVIDLILSYRNPADEETRMRQIRVVMD